MKSTELLRHMIVYVTVACLLLAVVAFFLPHGIGSMCAVGTIVLAVVDLILCVLCVLTWVQPSGSVQ